MIMICVRSAAQTLFSKPIPALYQLDRTEGTRSFITSSQFPTLASNPEQQCYRCTDTFLFAAQRKNMACKGEKPLVPRCSFVEESSRANYSHQATVTRLRKLQGGRSGGGCSTGEKQIASHATSSCQLNLKLL